MRISIEMSIGVDENDINLNPDEICDLVEKILHTGTEQNGVYLNNIFSISRSDEE